MRRCSKIGRAFSGVLYWAVAFLFSAIHIPAHADDIPLGRYKHEIAILFTPRETAFAEVAWTWTPEDKFDYDGWRFRLGSAAGLFLDRNPAAPALLIPTYYYEFSAGYRKRFGNWLTTSWVGLLGVEEISFTPFSRLGVRLTEQVVWSDSKDYYAALVLRYETVRNAFSSTINLGFLTPLDFKLGPEVGFSASDAGTGYRVGLAATGIEFFGLEFGLSGGLGQRERGRGNVYLSAYLHQFF